MKTILLTIILLLIHSCGEALGRRRKSSYDQILGNSLLMCAPQDNLSSLFEESSELEKKIEVLVIANEPTHRILFRDITDTNLVMSPISELQINASILQKQITRLRDEYFKIKRMDTDIAREGLLLNLKENQQKFYQRLVRYNNLLCQKKTFQDKQELDVRPYYILENLLKNDCEEDVYCLANKIVNAPESLNAQTFFKMCSVTESSEFCKRLAGDEQLFAKEFSNLMNNYKKIKISYFYDVEAIGPKFACENKDGVEHMRVHLYSSQITLDERDIKIINKIWNTDAKMKVSFYFSKVLKEDSIEIKTTNKGVSFVESNNPQIIYISSLITSIKDEFLTTVAHEIGHSLGLADCYLEFLDENLTSVYYQLETSNLMCAIGATSRITSESLVSIFKNRCLN